MQMHHGLYSVWAAWNDIAAITGLSADRLAFDLATVALSTSQIETEINKPSKRTSTHVSLTFCIMSLQCRALFTPASPTSIPSPQWLVGNRGFNVENRKKTCEHQHEQPASQPEPPPFLKTSTTCVKSSGCPIELFKHACAARTCCQKPAWNGPACRAMKRTQKRKQRKRLLLCVPAHPSSRHANVIAIINQMSWPQWLRELSVCVLVSACVWGNPKTFSPPLDIAVLNLISGLFEDCKKPNRTNSCIGLEGLLCVAHIMDHAGIMQIALMFNP